MHNLVWWCCNLIMHSNLCSTFLRAQNIHMFEMTHSCSSLLTETQQVVPPIEDTSWPCCISSSVSWRILNQDCILLHVHSTHLQLVSHCTYLQHHASSANPAIFLMLFCYLVSWWNAAIILQNIYCIVYIKSFIQLNWVQQRASQSPWPLQCCNPGSLLHAGGNKVGCQDAMCVHIQEMEYMIHKHTPASLQTGDHSCVHQ